MAMIVFTQRATVRHGSVTITGLEGQEAALDGDDLETALAAGVVRLSDSATSGKKSARTKAAD